MSRVLAVVAAALVAVSVAGCRGGSGSGSGPGSSVERQIGDVESTLDRIESELDDG